MVPKFVKGDVVKLADKFPDCMSHFNGCGGLAIVMKDSSCGNGVQYSLLVKGYGESSWYPESLLTLKQERRIDLIEEWSIEASIEHERRCREIKDSNSRFILEMIDEAAEKGITDPVKISSYISDKIRESILSRMVKKS